MSHSAKSLQSCPTLCDPVDGSPPGSAVPGILQARTLEWVAISFSSAWKWKVKVKSLSHAWLFATPWTEAHQAPPSMGFSRQEYWSGVSLPSPMSHTSKLQKWHLIPVVCLWLQNPCSSHFALTDEYPDGLQKWGQFVWSHKNSELVSKIVSMLLSSVSIILELRDITGKLFVRK